MKKNMFRIIAIIALIFSIGLISSAYFTAPTEKLINTFTVGKMDPPDIDEPNWPGDDPETLTGVVVAKDPTITLGEFMTESYVYMAIRSALVYPSVNGLIDVAQYYHSTTYTTPAPGEIVDVGLLGFDPAWILIATDKNTTEKTITYIFRYQTTVSATGSRVALEPIFGAVGFDENLTAEQIDLIEMDNDKQSIDIKGFVHQKADGLSINEIDDIVKEHLTDPNNW